MGITDAVIRMADFTHVLYDVDHVHMQNQMPPGFEVVTFNIHGYKRSLVSAVFFRGSAHLGKFPFVRTKFSQLSFRTDVEYKGKRGVFFFAQHYDSLLFAPGKWVGIRWDHATIAIDAKWDKGLERLEMMSLCKGGNSWLSVTGHEDARGLVFAEASTLRGSSVFDPIHGWMRTKHGKILKFQATHDPLEPVPALVKSARFAILENMGIIDVDQKPIGCYVQKSITYRTKLPWFVHHK